MEAIEFQSVVVGDSIRVPEQYKQFITKMVRVIIMPTGNGKIKPARRPGPGMLMPGDFSALGIDTTGWKFSREEANERR